LGERDQQRRQSRYQQKHFRAFGEEFPPRTISADFCHLSVLLTTDAAAMSAHSKSDPGVDAKKDDRKAHHRRQVVE
jgi:hypothetical protein